MTRQQIVRLRRLCEASKRNAPPGFVPWIMEVQWPYLPKSQRPNNNLKSQTRRSVRKQFPICVWCRVAPSDTIDHVVPLKRGGRNNRLNLVGACKMCNTVKADFLPRELGWKLYPHTRTKETTA